MQKIRLILSVSEVNDILEALGLQPYASVYRLVARIQEQAAGQLDSDERHRDTETPERSEDTGA